MRDASTYRGARRNACLRSETKGVWGDRYAIAANARAKLDVRQKQCADAMDVVTKAMVMVATAGGRANTVVQDALRDYWLTQKRTRVVSRILAGLKVA